MEEKKTKVCSHCHRELPLSLFSKSSSTKDGLQYYCKDCVRESVRKSDEKRRKEKSANEESSGLVQTAPSTRTTTVVPSSAKKVYHLESLAAISNRDLIEELKMRGFRGKLEYIYKIEL